MSVRSAYSSTSYRNFRPGARRHLARGEQKSAENPDCENCVYKRLVEKQLEQKPQEMPVNAVGTSPGQQLPTIQKTTEIDASKITEKQKKDEPKGMMARFAAYVQKNQEANRRAGETSLFDDLGKYADGISKGASRLGEEEMDFINRKKSSQKSVKERAEEDDDRVDFLMGKRKHK